MLLHIKKNIRHFKNWQTNAANTGVINKQSSSFVLDLWIGGKKWVKTDNIWIRKTTNKPGRRKDMALSTSEVKTGKKIER